MGYIWTPDDPAPLPDTGQSEMQTLLNELRESAIAGQYAIEGGDWARYQLPDSEFKELCAKSGFDEDDVIEAMVDTDEWWRGSEGFNLRKWWTEPRPLGPKEN